VRNPWMLVVAALTCSPAVDAAHGVSIAEVIRDLRSLRLLSSLDLTRTQRRSLAAIVEAATPGLLEAHGRWSDYRSRLFAGEEAPAPTVGPDGDDEAFVARVRALLTPEQLDRVATFEPAAEFSATETRRTAAAEFEASFDRIRAMSDEDWRRHRPAIVAYVRRRAAALGPLPDSARTSAVLARYLLNPALIPVLRRAPTERSSPWWHSADETGWRVQQRSTNPVVS